MELIRSSKKPHVLCIPFPVQGHISPMLKLAKLLYSRGVKITFVNTIFNHTRLLRSRGPEAVAGLPDFKFESIPDGLPPCDDDVTQSVSALFISTPKYCLDPLVELIRKLSGCDTPVSCIMSDGVMSFTLKAAEIFGIPNVLFWTQSACGLLCYTQFWELVKRGIVPLKDVTCLVDGYMETTIDWVDGLLKDMKLKDFPSFVRTTNPDDMIVKCAIDETNNIPKASALVLNTFDELEQNALNALRAIQPRIYTLGPLHLTENQIDDEQLKSINSNLWKDDHSCIEWLNMKEPNSVVYVNFGSVTTLTTDQIAEFAWGLANSKKPFLWIIRPDMVAGESSVLTQLEFMIEVKERSTFATWSPRAEKVLGHAAVGVFLTHCGWNSIMESLSEGVPLICWPFFAEQPMNCWYICDEWGIGVEIDNDVTRKKVEDVIVELMSGAKGKEKKTNAMKWKKRVLEAVGDFGNSKVNLDKLLNEVLLAK